MTMRTIASREAVRPGLRRGRGPRLRVPGGLARLGRARLVQEPPWRERTNMSRLYFGFVSPGSGEPALSRNPSGERAYKHVRMVRS